jgi:hypothetical protein
MVYYHPKCVGLDHLKSLDDGDRYSNCDDGESYKCPICEKNSKAMDRVHEHVDLPSSCADQTYEKNVSQQISDDSDDDTSTPQNVPDCDKDCSRGSCYDDARFIEEENENPSDTAREKKEDTTYFVDENDPAFLSNFFDDDEWDWNIHDGEECTSEQLEQKNGTTEGIKQLPISHDTLSRMMDCPGLPTTTYFIMEPPKEAHFQLSEDEWNRIKPLAGQPQKLQSSWTNVIARRMAESNAYCTWVLYFR